MLTTRIASSLAGLVTLVVLSACAPVALVPEQGVAPIPQSECRFTVNDLRPQPSVLWVKKSDGIVPAELTTPLAHAVRYHVCKRLTPEMLQTPSSFAVTDYDCYVSGFWTIKYLVEIRGRFLTGDGVQYELRQHFEHSDTSGVIKRGCEAATLQVLDLLASQIGPSLRKAPAKGTGDST